MGCGHFSSHIIFFKCIIQFTHSRSEYRLLNDLFFMDIKLVYEYKLLYSALLLFREGVSELLCALLPH